MAEVEETEDRSNPAHDVLASQEHARAPGPPGGGGGGELRPGDVLGARFVIERFADRGGMATVYRALDRLHGSPVAVKVVSGAGPEDERFVREARTLADLMHPAIVRYIAHGSMPDGRRYLAMEWLDGEDLATRLKRKGLGVTESLAVARRIAEGLSVAHDVGLVHRDVKPSNIFLVDCEPARAKLLDFGVVRVALSPQDSVVQPITKTGMLIGTVGYMSPEQATADRALDARTDVFALGCVLFECLTGAAAFSGGQMVAVLAKILRGHVPRARQLRPELPAALDELVARMMAKEKGERLENGGAVLRELQTLAPELPFTDRPPGEPAAQGLSGGERRIVPVMLVHAQGDRQRLREIVHAHGADVVELADGALLVTPGGQRATTDRLLTAADCALELRRAFPAVRIALATGWAQTSSDAPPGPVIDQAAELLAHSVAAGIRIDDVTAGLLGDRFEVMLGGQGATLILNRRDTDAPRTLLGRPTPCVGRERELALLGHTLRECIEDSVARPVLVTGPPGQGKSRVRHEFLAKVREAGGVTVLAARADPVGAGSAFMLVRQLVRHAAGIREGDPAPAQRAALQGYIAGTCARGDAQRIADFLGELIGAPTTERPGQELRAARTDAQIMAVWLSRSFGEWLDAVCSARPLLVVLEDLHWGDLPSVTYLAGALQSLAAKPFMLLALARPEVHDTFPGLWKQAERMEVPLGRLTPRSADKLVQAVLGDSVSPQHAARLVQRADGNAFYLEELIRHVAEGARGELPETVLALVQSRLERLEPEARRLVRAASVYGDVFWKGGVAALLGPGIDGQDLATWLAVLADREVITPASESRFPGEREYVFRHALLREVAYATLTAEDLRQGHRLAGQWLQKAGEKDALTVADHLERGGELAQALPWLRAAAQAAFEGGNVEAALSIAARGLACSPVDAERAELMSARAQALGVSGAWREALDEARAALPLLAPGSSLWFRAAGNVLLSGTLAGEAALVAPLIQEILRIDVPPEFTGPYGLSMYCVSTALCRVGKAEHAHALLRRAESFAAATSDPEPVFLVWIRAARAYLQLAGGELGGALANLAEARALAERAAYTFGRAVPTLHALQAIVQVGHRARAEALSRELTTICEPLGLQYLIDHGYYAVARLGLMEGRVEEAIAAFRGLLDRQDATLVIRARAHLAHALLASGDVDGAMLEANAALRGSAMHPEVRAIALTPLARVAQQRGRHDEALAHVELALKGSMQAAEESALRLVRVEALEALGRDEESRAALREARDRIERIAADLEGDDLRASYRAWDTNAATLELAERRLGAPGGL